MANMSQSMEYASVCQNIAFLGEVSETRTVARWTCRVRGSWGGRGSASLVQVVLAAQVIFDLGFDPVNTYSEIIPVVHNSDLAGLCVGY